MHLAIVGSRNLNRIQAIDAGILILAVFSLYVPENIDTFVSGGADGIDKMAEAQAHHLGVPCRIFLPKSLDWEGYRTRNVDIAEACDVLYAIRSKQSKTYGSGWTADYAEKIGKEVHRYYV